MIWARVFESELKEIDKTIGLEVKSLNQTMSRLNQKYESLIHEQNDISQVASKILSQKDAAILFSDMHFIRLSIDHLM